MEPVPKYEDLFPAKLHYVLGQAEDDDVIAWQPHGKAFLVNNRERFVDEYLPNWFRQTTWASFQRQLNHYDFKRITEGPDRNAYYHPHFVQEDRSLCRYIRRVTIKGMGPRKPSKPEEQPDFYSHRDPFHIAALSVAIDYGSASPMAKASRPAVDPTARPSVISRRSSSASSRRTTSVAARDLAPTAASAPDPTFVAAGAVPAPPPQQQQQAQSFIPAGVAVPIRPAMLSLIGGALPMPSSRLPSPPLGVPSAQLQQQQLQQVLLVAQWRASAAGSSPPVLAEDPSRFSRPFIRESAARVEGGASRQVQGQLV